MIVVMSIIVGVITRVIAVRLLGKTYSVNEEVMANTIEVILGIWGTLLGFLISAESIFIAFNGSKLTEEFKKTGHFKTVFYVYTFTSIEIFIAMIAFLIVFIVRNFTYIMLKWLFFSIGATFTMTFFCIILLASLMATIFKS